jgi:transcription antitermination factor NusG
MHEAVPAAITHSEPTAAAYETAWFGVQTKPRHEKRVAAELEEKGVAVFLPLFSVHHQWSDRKRQVQLPLFSNYTFVRIREERRARVTVLQTQGVLGFVGVRGIGVPIPDEQIQAVQTILKEKVRFMPHPFLDVGDKVRIRGGSLDGIEGILSTVNDDRSLIVSVAGVQRSLAIRIDGYGIEPI